MRWDKKRGFTLIELLVVLVIMGVLFSIIVPAISSARERAHVAGCMNNLMQLAAAAFMYADDHDGIIPDVADTSDYLDDEDVYVCSKDTRENLGISKPSYTACADTPTSLLPSGSNGSSFAETILYIESDEAGQERDDIIANTQDEGGHYVFRHHSSKLPLAFADGHVIFGFEVGDGGGPGHGCFLAGTPILLADGTNKPIEQLQVGDGIMAFIEEAGEFKPDTVKHVFIYPAEKGYLIINGRLKVTPRHRFYIEGQWVRAQALRVGDILMSSKGKPEPITSIERIDEIVTVYNLEVNPYHTFIAGGVVVHNVDIDGAEERPIK